MRSKIAERGYQGRTVRRIVRAWEGHRSVLTVSPTGSGKTEIGSMATSSFRRIAWVVHRRELVHQAFGRLSALHGRTEVGVILAGKHPRSSARIQVCSVQTLLNREYPGADVVVFDEAHHYRAETYSQVVEHYRGAKVLGLTATPQRGDGLALGDAFSHLVVAATYSELVRDGWLVPACVYRPDEDLGGDLAMAPFEAWARYAPGTQAVGFLPSVALARAAARDFSAAGEPAAVVAHDTPTGKRETALARFRRGELTALFCCDTLTEGVDLPSARTVILGRRFRFEGAYVQAAGRGLRVDDRDVPGRPPFRFKPDAIFLDLTGCTLDHGLPTDDREYSLDGSGMQQEGGSEGAGRDPVERRAPELVNAPLRLVTPGLGLGEARVPASGRPGPVDLATAWRRIRRSNPADKAMRIFYKQYGKWPPISMEASE